MDEATAQKVKRHTADLKRELGRGDMRKAASRFENVAAGALSALGNVNAYTPQELQFVAEAGAVGSIQELRRRMQEALALLDGLEVAPPPAQDLAPAGRDDDSPRVLDALN